MIFYMIRSLMKIEKAIFDLLNRTYVNNAAGPDKIDSKLIKFCAKGFARPLSSLYNKIFNRERFQISGNLLMSFLFFKKVIQVRLLIKDRFPLY